MKRPNKLNLAHLPTPLEKIRFQGKEFLIKRDDYTGSDLIGNKVRKLVVVINQIMHAQQLQRQLNLG